MTEQEKHILEVFAVRFPSSAAATGGRALKLRTAVSFPELERAGANEKESFLEAAEKLEKEGLLAIDWEKHRKGEAIRALTLVSCALLFARLGRESPEATAHLAAAEARAAAERAVSREEKAFFHWIAANIGAEDGAKGIDAGAVRDFARLPLFSTSGPIEPVRALSVKLFSDSKHLERLILRLRPLLIRAGRAGVSPPDLSPFRRKFPETLISGRLVFTIDGSAFPLRNDCGMILGLPSSSASHIRRIQVIAPPAHGPALQSVLGVENKETFYALSRALLDGSYTGASALVYVGGHPNRAVKTVFRAFARSGFALFHAGDLDPDGILILQELADAAGKTVTPRKMDSETFDRFFAFSRPLESTSAFRAGQIRDDTRALPGIEGLLARILATGRGVEQEIIGY